MSPVTTPSATPRPPSIIRKREPTASRCIISDGTDRTQNRYQNSSPGRETGSGRRPLAASEREMDAVIPSIIGFEAQVGPIARQIEVCFATSFSVVRSLTCALKCGFGITSSPVFHGGVAQSPALLLQHPSVALRTAKATRSRVDSTYSGTLARLARCGFDSESVD